MWVFINVDFSKDIRTTQRKNQTLGRLTGIFPRHMDDSKNLKNLHYCKGLETLN